jgi:hypothetical protein
MSDSDDDIGLAGIFWGNIGEGGHKLEVDYLDEVLAAEIGRSHPTCMIL